MNNYPLGVTSKDFDLTLLEPANDLHCKVYDLDIDLGYGLQCAILNITFDLDEHHDYEITSAWYEIINEDGETIKEIDYNDVPKNTEHEALIHEAIEKRIELFLSHNK